MGSSISSLNNTSFPVFFAIACNAGFLGIHTLVSEKPGFEVHTEVLRFLVGLLVRKRHSNNRILRKLFLDTSYIQGTTWSNHQSWKSIITEMFHHFLVRA
jgi:hypothetical protein